MRNPPVLVAVLGFFGALAGFGFLFMNGPGLSLMLMKKPSGRSLDSRSD